MNQDTSHYYLVTLETVIVGRNTRMIFRSFKEIEKYLQGTSSKATIELVPCADFSKQGKSFDGWKSVQKDHKGPVPGQTLPHEVETPEEQTNALEALKSGNN
jgi:hypothetical protein